VPRATATGGSARPTSFALLSLSAGPNVRKANSCAEPTLSHVPNGDPAVPENLKASSA